MIHSMTGFARRETHGDWGTLAWEIRSVNHRYLELAWRLPEELRPMEPAFRKAVGKHLKRGKVDCGLRLRWSDAAQPAIKLNPTALAQLAGALDGLSASLPGIGAADPLDVLRWPRVIEDSEKDLGPVEAAALDLLEEALGELRATRRREGERLAKMLLERCDAIEKLVSEARIRLPEIRAALRARTLDKLGQLDAETDTDRVEQELVLLAQKMDVEEELDRLGAHLDEVRRVLATDEAVGRRLDFLMQEFNREANTLASKSQSSESTRIAVELKVLIEQMREQVQNIE
jgi:uncharacterized protein (TIGR00255 family)